MGNIGKATEPRSINNQWQPTSDWHLFDSHLFSLYRFMSRQHVYDLEKRRGDCLMKWLIMLGFTDLRGPRVCRRSTPVLFNVASDWLAALLAANQKLHLKIVVSFPCFYPRIALVARTPGQSLMVSEPLHSLSVTVFLFVPNCVEMKPCLNINSGFYYMKIICCFHLKMKSIHF